MTARATVPLGQPTAIRRQPPPWLAAWRRLLANRMAVLGGLIVLLFVVLAAVGEFLTPHDPLYQDLMRISEGPSRDYWLGTDELGRDFFSRILAGARTALLVAALVTFIAAGLGTVIGLISAYLGGWVDGTLMRLARGEKVEPPPSRDMVRRCLRLGLAKIVRPKGNVIRQMLDLIRRRCREHGLEQCAVWSFLRPRKKKFSSITRHHYLGFGPSAASMTGNQFFVNTFSIEEYAAALPVRLPVALVLPVDRRLEMAYWLYWRIYEMKLGVADFHDLFGEDLDAVYGRSLKMLTRMGMMERTNGCYRVTEGAAYWVHRFQNEYSLNYINRLWGRCRQDAWPPEVML